MGSAMYASHAAATLDQGKAQTHNPRAKLRIVFMGSPTFAIPCLDRLNRTHIVCAVYSQPAKKSGRGLKMTPLPVANYAKKMGLPLFTPDSLKPANIQTQLASHRADLFVVVAYGLLLPAAILTIPHFGCLNGHASLLPRWRGAAPIQRAIEAGDIETGISAMLMEKGLDTGPLVDISRIEITKEETGGSLHDRLSNLTASCLGTVIDTAPDSLASPTPQSEDGLTYATKIMSEDTMIDWTRPAANLDYHVRAFAPYPNAWCNGPKGRLGILQARQINLPDNAPNDSAGRFLGQHSDGSMIVGCGINALAISQLQPAGKKAMAAVDFLKGAGLKIDDILEPTGEKEFP